MAKMLINGDLVDSTSGETLAVTSPVDGEEFTTIPRGSSEDVDNAVQAARSALNGQWE